MLEQQLACHVKKVCTSSLFMFISYLSPTFLDVAFVFDNEFLDTPMTSQERLRAALRIQPNWSIIGRILGPKPFEHFEMHAFEEKRNNRDRALDMLDAWANKFGTRATRRHFINAVKDPDVGYSDEVANIFSGKLFVGLRFH